MDHVETFFETQPAFTAMTRLLDMAREQDDMEGIVEISHGLQYCESLLEHFYACYLQEDAEPVA